MRTSHTTAVARLVRAARARLEASDEGGFILLEVMISLTLITAIMAGVTVEYVNGMVVSGYQRSVATASQVASTALTDLRSVSATDLVRGRDATNAAKQRDRMVALGAKVVNRMQSAEDYLAFDNATDPQVVPTAPETVANGSRPFTVESYLECQEPAAVRTTNGVQRRDCLDTTTAGAVNGLRAVVAVTWAARGCPSSRCVFVATTLIDPHGNPSFDPNQALPPAPIVTTPADQTVAVGESVSLQLLVQDGSGVAPFTWAISSMPTGLSMSPGGLITGTVGGSPTTVTSTVTVTDGFARQATATFKWTVVSPLTFVQPQDQKNWVSQPISAITLSANGGGGGYRYTDPGRTLPAGLTLEAATGRITGTPTTVREYPVGLVVTDSQGRTASTAFIWTIGEKPFMVAGPGPQVTTVNRPFPSNQRVTTSGGSGQGFTFTANGLPTGLTIGSSTGLLAGTATTVTSGPVPVTVTVKDNGSGAIQTADFTVHVVGPPSIITPGAQSTTRGGSARLQVAATCPNGPCATFSIVNQPKGLVIDNTGLITGTLASDAAASTTVRVTVTDQGGATATTANFSWSIVSPPTAAALPNITTPRLTDVSRDFSGTFSGGTKPYTYSATGLPEGLTIDPSSGVVTGTTADVNSKNSVTIRIVDASGATASSSFTWYVSNLNLAFSDQIYYARNNTFSYNLNNSRITSGGVPPYTFSATGMIGNPDLWLDAPTLRAAPRPEKVGVYYTTLTVTDSVGATFTRPVKFDIRK